MERITETQTLASIKRLSINGGFSRSSVSYFQAAYQLAKQSDFGGFSIGCVLVYKGNIIGSGYNSRKTDPDQRKYNLKYRNFNKFRALSSREHSIHAEMAAIKSVPYTKSISINWSKVKAYVFRIAPGLPEKQGIAKPCVACTHALFDKGITTVYFSDSYGFSKLVLDKELIEADKPYANRENCFVD